MMSFAWSIKVVVFVTSFSCATAPGKNPTIGRGRSNAVTKKMQEAVNEFNKAMPNVFRIEGRGRAGALFEIEENPEFMKQKAKSAAQTYADAFCEKKGAMDPHVFRHISLVAKQFYRTFGDATPIIVGDSKGAVGVLLAGLELERGKGEPRSFFVLPSHESKHWTYLSPNAYKHASLPLQSHLFLSLSPGLRFKQVGSSAPIVEIDPQPEKEIVKRASKEQRHLLQKSAIIGLCMQRSDTLNLIESAVKLMSQKEFSNGSRIVCITTRSKEKTIEISKGMRIEKLYISELLGILIEKGHFRECYGRTFDFQTMTPIEELSEIDPFILRDIVVYSHTFATVPAFQNWVKHARTTLLKKREGRRVVQCESNLIKRTDSEHDELEYEICVAFLRDKTGERVNPRPLKDVEFEIELKREHYKKRVKKPAKINEASSTYRYEDLAVEVE